MLVKIHWTAPTYNGGSIVLGYRIKILESNGFTLTEELTYCDGSDPTIKANKYCLIPMTTITGWPF